MASPPFVILIVSLDPMTSPVPVSLTSLSRRLPAKLVVTSGEIKKIEVERLETLVHQKLIADAGGVLHKIENMYLAI